MRAPTSRKPIRLKLEHLEDRSVPATVALTGTTLTVLGGPINEQIDVTQSGGTITANGQSFASSQVQRLVIDAGAGDDTIAVGAGVTAQTYIYAGGGHDLVTGGGGTTTIYGGTGNDTITAGPGPTTVYGGPGANSILGKPGDSITQGTTYAAASPSALAQQILDLTNQQRAANGLAPLTMSPQLTAGAQLHSSDMASLAPVVGDAAAMQHTLVGGQAPTLGARADVVGYAYSFLGENIAYGYGTAQAVMDAWMNSPGHRANILDPDYTQIGIAVAYAADGMPYMTQFFGTPLPSNPTGPSPVTTSPPTATTTPPPANISTPPTTTTTTTTTSPTTTPTASVTVTDGFGGGSTKVGQIYVTGANAGSAPNVTVYDMATGRIKLTFLAYAATFKGGVRVAVADMNGDGQQDVITAPGPGYSPVVRIFDGATGREIRSFYAYAYGYLGGVNVAAGDVTGDHKPDIVTSTDRGSAGLVRVFNGGMPTISRAFYAYSGTTAGARVAMGDINGDGRADIITAPVFGIAPLVRVFSGATGAQLMAFNAFDPRWLGGAFVAAGDLNGDGKADIVIGADAGGGAAVRAFSGADPSQVLANFYTDAYTGGVRVAVRDVTGDGKAEIITAQGAGGRQVRLRSSNGASVLASFLAGDAALNNGVFVA
jgi:uncharacterized protein YkwD